MPDQAAFLVARSFAAEGLLLNNGHSVGVIRKLGDPRQVLSYSLFILTLWRSNGATQSGHLVGSR